MVSRSTTHISIKSGVLHPSTVLHLAWDMIGGFGQKRVMWAALQRRFNDQNRPGCARELLARGLKVLPIDGQTSSVTWSLGFKETGSCSRTASLSRDFQSLASMVEAEQACYLVAFVGDLHGGSMGGVATSNMDPAKWILISFVPESISASLAKRMADNRTGLKVRRAPNPDHRSFCRRVPTGSRDGAAGRVGR